MAQNLNIVMQSFNATMQKFGAPGTCIRNYKFWSVMLRPAQVTLGSLILAAFEPANAFSQLSQPSFNELHTVTKEIEQGLKKAFAFDKLNYLMLMMVDPDVHFHVIPRYSGPKKFVDREYYDAGWPGPPELGKINETDGDINHQIMDHIGACMS